MDGLRCKVGDTAIFIGKGACLGALFECLEPHRSPKGAGWKVKLLSRAWNYRTQRFDPPGTVNYRGPYDRHLRPLRGDPLEELFPPLKEPLHA